MNTTRPQFLDDALSTFRAEYLTTISTNLPTLLEEFDRHVLGGFSPEKDRKYPVATTAVEVTGAEARPVYDNLTARLSQLTGEQREELLYGLRRRVVQEEDEVKRFGDGVVSLLQHLLPLAEAHDPLLNPIVDFGLHVSDRDARKLRDESIALRDKYKVMVDLVRAHYENQPTPPAN